jgi:hypothetical protein
MQPMPPRLPSLHLRGSLRRYLWPYDYFRDVTRGTPFEQEQNYRHNRQMGACLPAFIRRWAFLTLVFFGIGTLLEELLQLVLPAACCYVTGTWTLTIVIQLVVAWLWLKRFPRLHER